MNTLQSARIKLLIAQYEQDVLELITSFYKERITEEYYTDEVKRIRNKLVSQIEKELDK